MKQTGGKERKRSEKQACLDYDTKRGRRICSGCGIEKRFAFNRESTEGKKLFLDDLDKLWIGSRCSECGPKGKKKGKGRWPHSGRE